MNKLYIRQPFRFGAGKQTVVGTPTIHNGIAVTNDPDRHLKDKIMAVLFTAPGERLNNPRFGAGLNRVVFDGLNELTITAVEYRVLEGLRRDIGDEIIVDSVDIRANEQSMVGELLLTITYCRREDRETQTLGIEL